METFSAIGLPCRGGLFTIIVSALGLLAVSAVTEVPGATMPPDYPKCVTSCTDENGQNLPAGFYADCNDCRTFIGCNAGYMSKQTCANGTVYYNRVTGVCVTDKNVCFNDSQPTTRPTTNVTTTSTSSTTPETTSLSAPSTATPSESTTSSTITTFSTTTTLSQTQPPTTYSTSTTQTSTYSTTISTTTATTASPQNPPTISSTPSLTNPTTTATLSTSAAPTASASTTTTITTTTPTTTTTSLFPTATPFLTANTTAGYIPTTGPEAESLLFALDLYNNNSNEKMRAGVLRINSVTKQNLGSDNDTWYRLFGVLLAQSSCLNTKENMNADIKKCPLLEPTTETSNQFVARCNFKVRYQPQAAIDRLSMVYMMCYR